MGAERHLQAGEIHLRRAAGTGAYDGSFAALPAGSTLAGFLFVAYDRFQFKGRPAGLLLCIGVTADEIAACRRNKQQQVFDALKAAGVYPYTDLFRASVLPRPRWKFW